MSEQTTMLSILDSEISKVFGTKPVLGKGGANVGVSVTLRTQKEIKASLPGLDKEQLQEAVLLQQDNAFRKVRAEITGLDPSWTLHKVTRRNLADDVQQITVVARKINRTKQISDEKVAKSWFPDADYPTMTLEEKVARVREMRERQQKELAAKQIELENETKDTGTPDPEPAKPAIDVPSTITDAPADPVVPPTAEEEEFARQLAEEEAAKAQQEATETQPA